MFTINLLKEETVSTNYLNKTVGYFIAAILPAAMIVVMTLLFLGNTAVLASQKRRIAKYNTSITELSDALKMQKRHDAEQASIKQNLSELSVSLGSYTQWSPILVEIIKDMPDKMIITNLQVSKGTVNRRITASDGSVRPVKQIKNTLVMNLSGGSQHNYDKDVREYGDSMRASKVLKHLGLEQISTSQKEDNVDGQKVVSYNIQCVFITN
jgi:hypothetical protein